MDDQCSGQSGGLAKTGRTRKRGREIVKQTETISDAELANIRNGMPRRQPQHAKRTCNAPHTYRLNTCAQNVIRSFWTKHFDLHWERQGWSESWSKNETSVCSRRLQRGNNYAKNQHCACSRRFERGTNFFNDLIKALSARHRTPLLLPPPGRELLAGTAPDTLTCFPPRALSQVANLYLPLWRIQDLAEQHVHSPTASC